MNNYDIKKVSMISNLYKNKNQPNSKYIPQKLRSSILPWYVSVRLIVFAFQSFVWTFFYLKLKDFLYRKKGIFCILHIGFIYKTDADAEQFTNMHS